MDTDSTKQAKVIGIIGGGKVGLQLFNLFVASSLTQVAYVVDINPDAPALVAARKKNVRAITDLQAALSIPVDFLLEVTGNAKVVETISQQMAGKHTSLITHEMAFIILSVISENDQRIKGEVVAEMSTIKDQIAESLSGIQSLVTDIEDVTSEMNILTMNAQIEAARVGEAGKGFAVVAMEMRKSTDKVHEITSQIGGVNAKIKNASQKIDVSLGRLA